MKNKSLFFASAVYFIIAITIHLSAVFQHSLISPDSLVFFVMHIAAIGLFAPNVVVLAKKQKQLGRKLTVKELIGNAPMALKIFAGISFIYVIVNFIFFFINCPFTPGIQNGNYYLHSHGKIIRNITLAEYEYYNGLITRGFSGHWVLFTLIAMVLDYPFERKENVN